MNPLESEGLFRHKLDLEERKKRRRQFNTHIDRELADALLVRALTEKRGANEILEDLVGKYLQEKQAAATPNLDVYVENPEFVNEPDPQTHKELVSVLQNCRTEKEIVYWISKGEKDKNLGDMTAKIAKRYLDALRRGQNIKELIVLP